jgi:hypothetical protein
MSSLSYKFGMLAARTAHAMLLTEPCQLEVAYSRRGLWHGRRYLSQLSFFALGCSFAPALAARASVHQLVFTLYE